jgi:molybdopterin synthase sulfur carrier subunit
MPLTIRYFAAVREKLGAQESVSLSDTPARTVGALHTWLQSRSAEHAQALDPDRGLRTACNQALCDADQPLADGDEVAFFPPVTGG